MNRTYYSAVPSKERPLTLQGKERYYVIDLPSGEWGATALVNSKNRRLETGDMIKLPNGSWLEVKVDESCGGTDSKLYGLLDLLCSPHDDTIYDNDKRAESYKDIQENNKRAEHDKDIQDKRTSGKVYETFASYIR